MSTSCDHAAQLPERDGVRGSAQLRETGMRILDGDADDLPSGAPDALGDGDREVSAARDQSNRWGRCAHVASPALT
jgi:hypothetical protein